MGSQAVKLPVIDFSREDLKPGTPTWNSVKVEVMSALQDFGCFTLLYDEIPTEIRKSLFESLEEFFDLPFETKSRQIPRTIFQGYNCNPSLQSLVIDELKLPENVDSFANIMWPQGNSKFSETAKFYLEKLPEWINIVRMMVLESLGLEKYMEEHMNSTDILLRANQYKVPQSNEKILGLRTHSDKGLLGILIQNETQGLEMLTKDGQWIECNFTPNTFLVLPGDLFNAWTNGRVHAAVHRVMLTGNCTRYSFGLFSYIKPGSIVKAPEELVDEQHPLLYKPFQPFELLGFYYTRAGQSSESPLKTYCGL